MSVNWKIVNAFNTVASILGWTALGLAIASVASDRWIDDGTIRRSGLWNTCTEFGGCTRIPADSWLRATRAFMILMSIFLFFAGLSNVVSQCKISKKTREGSGGTFSLAGLFGVVGAVVYTNIVNQSALSFNYGIGFIFAWTAVGLAFLTGICQQISAHYMPENEETNDINPEP